MNLTFCSHISVDEVLNYSPHPTDPSKTLLRQEASVSVHGVPLKHYMEDLITHSISSNAGKGRQGLEWVISKINLEVKNTPFKRHAHAPPSRTHNSTISLQVKGIADAVTKSTDEIITQTSKSFDGMTETARKSMDEISSNAKHKIGF